MSDSPLRRGLTGLAALLGLAAPACVDPPGTAGKTTASGAAATTGSGPGRPADQSPEGGAQRRPGAAIDRDRPPRVATATFALG